MTDHALFQNELKAVVLAAGKGAIAADAQPIVLQNLGSRKIVDYVVENALQVVLPGDLYIVVGCQQAEVQTHLGPRYRYVVQPEPLGTGHAVLQLHPQLKDFDGDLLILYGDTPLFRATSIRGLLNRHYLRQSDLTLLTAVVDRALPYGRIIRDADNQIVDIIEETEASPRIREIRELNVGAYVVRAQPLFRALEKLSPSPDGEYRLTDCVHHLIHSGLRVESYQIYDQDEVQGINTAEDLARAEFILQKRLFQPRRAEEQNQVSFGTGGWRAIIGEGFHAAQCPSLESGVSQRDDAARRRKARRLDRF